MGRIYPDMIIELYNRLPKPLRYMLSKHLYRVSYLYLCFHIAIISYICFLFLFNSFPKKFKIAFLVLLSFLDAVCADVKLKEIHNCSPGIIIADSVAIFLVTYSIHKKIFKFIHVLHQDIFNYLDTAYQFFLL